MKLTTRATLLFPLLLVCAWAPSCDNDAFEEAGEEVDEAVDDVEDAVD